MMKTEKTPLETAVEQTNNVAGHFKKGLHAVKNEYRPKISAADARKLTGSVDVDNATHLLFPDANRWDYAIEYNNKTYFVEFHPASTSNVEKMIEKLTWLNWWLKENAPFINALKPEKGNAYHWVATGGIKILSGSSQYRRLATLGILPKKIMVFK